MTALEEQDHPPARCGSRGLNGEQCVRRLPHMDACAGKWTRGIAGDLVRSRWISAGEEFVALAAPQRKRRPPNGARPQRDLA